MIIDIGGVNVTVEGGRMSWTSGLEVDVDGAPNAYALPSAGLDPLDDLRNAWDKASQKYVGVVCSDAAKQHPLIQGPTDPAPGFCVSQSALVNGKFKEGDPRRYVDASRVPYVVVPPQLIEAGAKKSDLCIVTYQGRRAGAIVADVGPRHSIGEGSYSLHVELGVDPKRARPAHHLVGISFGVSFELHLGTANSQPWPRPTLEQDLAALLAL